MHANDLRWMLRDYDPQAKHTDQISYFEEKIFQIKQEYAKFLTNQGIKVSKKVMQRRCSVKDHRPRKQNRKRRHASLSTSSQKSSMSKRQRLSPPARKLAGRPSLKKTQLKIRNKKKYAKSHKQNMDPSIPPDMMKVLRKKQKKRRLIDSESSTSGSDNEN